MVELPKSLPNLSEANINRARIQRRTRCGNLREVLKHRNWSSISALIALSLFAFVFVCAGCDPVITIAGANFPAWLLCMIVGAILAGMARPLLVIARIEPHVGPPTIFYPSLIAMFAMIVWVLFFNRT